MVSARTAVEGEVEIDVGAVIHRLPHASPVGACHLVALPLVPQLLPRPGSGRPRSRRVIARGGRGCPIVRGPFRGALGAEPNPGRHGIEVDAIGMEATVAAIAQQEQLFVVIGEAEWAGRKLGLVRFVDEERGVDLGFLDSVIDGVGADDGA